MNGWAWYWAALWEPAYRPPARETREPRFDADDVPAVAAGRLLRGPGAYPARARAAAGLQAVVGNRALAHAARPLPSSERVRLEAGLGTDLSAVRVAHDPLAAGVLAARAFAAGDRIVLADAADVHDRRLLAEEVVHVVQARARGTRPGVSRPGEPSERQARAAAWQLSAGRVPGPLHDGAPVPAVQRQERRPGEAAPPVAPGRQRPDLIRLLLALEYRRQGGKGPLRWTNELREGFARLLPDVDGGALARLWEPPPAGPEAAFARLVGAGFVPLLAQERPAEPAGEPSPGWAGLHLRVRTPPAAPPAATAARACLTRGIRLSPAHVDAMLSSRAQALEQYRLLLRAASGIDDATRTAVATWLADLSFDASVRAEAQPHSGAPPAPAPAVGPLPQLLRLADRVGVAVTISFDL